jgi:hypothetical protein
MCNHYQLLVQVKATDIVHLNPTIAIVPVRLRAADLGLVVVGRLVT